MRIRKSGCVESNQTCCCIEKFNAALSLYRVLGIALYFSEGFSETATRVSAVAEAPHLLLGAGVQLVVSCTTIETQVVFEVLFTLVTSQLAVAG